jgi:hypothetical protein
MKSIRVVLTITPAQREVFNDLQDVPARLRAERLRTLATLGLATIGGGLGLTRPERTAQPTTKDRPSKAIAFAQSIKGAL